MLLVVSAIILFLVIILVIVRFGIIKQKPDEEILNQTMIHTSGIYSIVRKSPRENIETYKPSEKEISQYLNEQNVDIQKNQLSESDKNALISLWKINLEDSITEIEEGDRKGLEFYYYDFQGEDKVCEGFLDKGYYVTRENIYAHPELIPPFHLGCRCILKCHPGSEDPRDTSELGMRPFLRNDKLPSLPDWKLILKI